MRQSPMNRSFAVFLSFFSALVLIVPSLAAQTAARAQSAPQPLAEFVAIPAVSGYETQLGKEISSKIAEWHPRTDNLGDVVVTIGSGAPHRLIVTPIDEPGF